MEKTQLLERMLEKYKFDVAQLSVKDKCPRSHYDDVANNLLMVMQLPIQSQHVPHTTAKKMYFDNLKLLKDYLRIVASDTEVNDAEMHTQQGYLDKQTGKNGYPPIQYVAKLKEFLGK